MVTKYSQNHEWVTVNGGIAVVGITHHAQDALGDVVFVGLPQVGSIFVQKDVVGVVESVKAAADVYMPISGEVIEINTTLRDTPALVNSDPLGAGWFFKVQISDPTQLDTLLDESAYAVFSSNA